MTSRLLTALVAALSLGPVAASAGCLTAGTGAGCVEAREPSGSILQAALTGGSATTPAVRAGAVLERGRYSIVLNADYYGLPPVQDGWVYMRVDRDVFRVDWRSHEVLERVTDRAAANF